MQSAIHFADRLSSFLLLLHSQCIRDPARRSDPQEMTSRHRRLSRGSVPLSCRRKCRQVIAWWVIFVLLGARSICSTLWQFLTCRFRDFVILRRHEHGRPVFRRESDLQGPKVGGRSPRQRLFGANLYLPSVPLQLPLLQGGCQVPRLSRILRGYGGVPEKQDDRTSHNALRNR